MKESSPQCSSLLAYVINLTHLKLFLKNVQLDLFGIYLCNSTSNCQSLALNYGLKFILCLNEETMLFL